MSFEMSASELVCPAGKASDPPVVINMTAILTSEARQEEIASVTPLKAPELLRAFNVAWRDLHDIIVKLESEHLAAERVLAKRKAVLILDVVPGILKEKTLTSNEANRDAVITLDPEFQVLQDTVDQIDTVVQYLKGKLKAFEMAFTSVKKIMGEDTYNMSNRPNPHLSGGADSKPAGPSFIRPVPTTPRTLPPRPEPTSIPGEGGHTPPAPARTGFGKPRY